MKKTALLVIFALALSACSYYYALSEPELPVVYVEFDKAVYDSAKCEIILTFPASVTYDYSGIFSFYNHSEGFNMSYYIKGNDINIMTSRFYKDKIVIGLYEDVQPLEIVFNTNTPWYFYKSEYSSTYSIEAKAYIATQNLPVEP